MCCRLVSDYMKTYNVASIGDLAFLNSRSSVRIPVYLPSYNHLQLCTVAIINQAHMLGQSICFMSLSCLQTFTDLKSPK